MGATQGERLAHASVTHRSTVMDKSELYTTDFYAATRDWVASSAGVIVPLVLDLVKPQSVVDVGCGIGVFLRVFQSHGVRDLLGVDGAHVKSADLQIKPEMFRAVDLERPVAVERQFDLVVSLEVAEHIQPANAAQFVSSLTQLGKVVLFSAAIPFQGGVDHVNEQWPDYWAKLFAARGFRVVDCLRGQLWNDEAVYWHYRQNVLLFAADAALDANPALRLAYETNRTQPLSLVHPFFFLRAANPENRVLSELLALLPRAAFKAAKRRTLDKLTSLR
jgi:SAM-dependent methyltransferase